MRVEKHMFLFLRETIDILIVFSTIVYFINLKMFSYYYCTSLFPNHKIVFREYVLYSAFQ